MFSPSAVDIQEEKTLGQQVLDTQEKYAGQVTQNIRDTTNEMGKEYMKSLWSIIESHAHLTTKYYISEFMKRDTIIPDAIHCKHVARLTMPLPEWGLACYRIDNQVGECFYEWGLPSEAEGEMILMNPLGWDKKTADDVIRFAKYLEFYSKNKPAQYGSHDKFVPIMVRKAAEKKVGKDIQVAFEAKLEEYWKKLLQDKPIG